MNGSVDFVKIQDLDKDCFPNTRIAVSSLDGDIFFHCFLDSTLTFCGSEVNSKSGLLI